LNSGFNVLARHQAEAVPTKMQQAQENAAKCRKPWLTVLTSSDDQPIWDRQDRLSGCRESSQHASAAQRSHHDGAPNSEELAHRKRSNKDSINDQAELPDRTHYSGPSASSPITGRASGLQPEDGVTRY
jgi:hypothetical protein